MKDQLLEKPNETKKPSGFFSFRTNSNRQTAETYINSFSEKSIYLQNLNAQGWMIGFRMGVVR